MPFKVFLNKVNKTRNKKYTYRYLLISLVNHIPLPNVKIVMQSFQFLPPVGRYQSFEASAGNRRTLIEIALALDLRED